MKNHIQKNIFKNILLLSSFPLICTMLLVISMPFKVSAGNSITKSNYGTYYINTRYVSDNNDVRNITYTLNCNDNTKYYALVLSQTSNTTNSYNLYTYDLIGAYSLASITHSWVRIDNGEETGSGSNTGPYTFNLYKDYKEYSYDTILPIFDSLDSFKLYCSSGDDSGQINKPIDMSAATYNSNIPMPKLVFNSKGGYKFSIDNAVDDYYIQIKGRWYTVDDITLFKENLQWKYKYDTLLKGTLTEWVEPNDKILATAEHDLCDMNRNGYGGEAFTALLTQYGIEQRSYSGGTNSLGNKLSGYTDALSMLKEFHLNNPLSAFNSPEIYIRFFIVNADNKVEYGKWCHWYSNLANSTGSSGFNLDDSDNVSGESQSYNGLTDDELVSNEQQENPRNDSDIYTYVNSDYIKQNLEISSDIANKTGAFFELLNSMTNAMGQFPQMFKDVFMFLPPWFINFIVIAMGAIIIARFIGR